MAMQPLEPDFSAFLKLLSENEVDFLLVGGVAVAFHGYSRSTSDLDVWIATSATNSLRVVSALKAFGFDVPELSPEIFQRPDQIVRMGFPPVRIELLTTIDGVEFEGCRRRALMLELDGIYIPVIGLEDLKANKRASGRHKDLDDLENLP